LNNSRILATFGSLGSGTSSSFLVTFSSAERGFQLHASPSEIVISHRCQVGNTILISAVIAIGVFAFTSSTMPCLLPSLLTLT
jgi:hypothetical protein